MTFADAVRLHFKAGFNIVGLKTGRGMAAGSALG